MTAPLSSVHKLVIQARHAIADDHSKKNFSQLSTSQRKLFTKIIKTYESGEAFDRFDKKATKIDKMTEKLAGTRNRHEGCWVSFTRILQLIFCMRMSSDMIKEKAERLIPKTHVHEEQDTTQELVHTLTGNDLRTDKDLARQLYYDWLRIHQDKLFIRNKNEDEIYTNQSIHINLPEDPPDHWDVCIPEELKTLVDRDERMLHDIALFLTQGIMGKVCSLSEELKDRMLLLSYEYPSFFFEKTEVGIVLTVESKSSQNIVDPETNAKIPLAYNFATQTINITNLDAVSTIDITTEPA